MVHILINQGRIQGGGVGILKVLIKGRVSLFFILLDRVMEGIIGRRLLSDIFLLF